VGRIPDYVACNITETQSSSEGVGDAVPTPRLEDGWWLGQAWVEQLLCPCVFHADPHGYAVVWNDDIDLAESEIWLKGIEVNPDPKRGC